jgi:hypothetical protein
VSWLTLLAPQGVLIRLGAVTLLAVAIFCFGWVKGAGHVEAKWEIATAAIEKAHDLEVNRLLLAGAVVETKFVERVKTVRQAAQVITKEVKVYVTAEDDRACHIPDGFVSLLNRAAQSSVPRADPAAVAADPATVARTVTP